MKITNRIIKDGARVTYLERVSCSEEKVRYDVGSHCDVCIVMPIVQSTDVRLDIHLHKPASHVRVVGLVLGKHTDSISLHTLQHHAAPESTSTLLVKSVLDHQATFFYEGSIRVDKSAQKTDAYQRNENLLLSPNAHADSKPALEILANDVRCTHGATIGTVSEEQLWYLATRGISKVHATKLLVHGFIESALSRIDDPEVKKAIGQQVSSSL